MTTTTASPNGGHHGRNAAQAEHEHGRLLDMLACAGYGWLRPEGVKRECEKMVANWHGLPPLPWEK
jgi:hypothetical protein